MEFIRGTALVRKDRSEVNADDALSSKAIIGFYFSAHWCPPCRMFTPVLADMYNDLMEEDAPFEVIFISSDRGPDEMFEYMNESHGNWLAVPHGSDVAKGVKTKYGITGIPTLVIVKQDGTLVTQNGRNDVQLNGAQAFKDWNK